MFCPNCGAQAAPAARFCPSCGTALAPAAQPAPTQPQPQSTVQAPAAPTPELKMGWFKFLICFGLFAGAVLNAGSGISLLTGAAYGEDADLVYAFFDGLKSLDTAIGVAMLVLAGLDIFTRFRLAKYRKNGPMMLTLTYIAAAAVNLIYIIALFCILPETVSGDLDITSTVTSVFMSLVMVFVNASYFKKRAHLFTK